MEEFFTCVVSLGGVHVYSRMQIAQKQGKHCIIYAPSPATFSFIIISMILAQVDVETALLMHYWPISVLIC